MPLRLSRPRAVRYGISAAVAAFSFIATASRPAAAQNTSWDPPFAAPAGIARADWARLKRLVPQGYAAERAGRWTEAYATFSEAARLAEPDRDSREFCLYRLALACRRLGKDAEVRAIADRLVELKRPETIPPDDWYRGLVIIQDAEEARYRYAFPEALRLWTEADRLFRPDAAARYWTLHNVTFFQRRMGLWPEAAETAAALETVAIALGRGNDAAEAAEWRGIALIYAGREEEAWPHLQRAWDWWRERDRHRHADSLCNAATALDVWANSSIKGGELTREAWEIYRIVKSDEAMMRWHGGHVHSLLRQGRTDRAIDRLLAIIQAPNVAALPGAAAPIYSMLAQAFRNVGAYREAHECVRRVAALSRAIRADEEAWRPGTLDSEAGIYRDEGLLERAEEAHKKQRALLERMAASPNSQWRLAAHSAIPYCLAGISEIRAAKGDYAAALELSRQAIALLDAAGRRYEQTEALQKLGDLYRLRGRLHEARASYDRAEALLPFAPAADIWQDLPRLRDRILAGRADVARRLGDRAAAANLYQDLTAGMEDDARIATDPDAGGLLQRALVGDTGNRVYHAWADVLRAEGRPAAEGLALVERGRAQGLARRVAESNALRSRLLPPEDAAALEAARRRAAAAYAAALQRRGKDLPSSPRIEKMAAADDYAALRRATARRFPEFGRLCQPEAMRPEAITALAKAHPDTLFLEWAVVDESRTLLYAVSSRGGVRCRPLPVGDRELAALARDWRAAVLGNGIARSREEGRLARRLYDVLIGAADKGDLLDAPGLKRLVLVADGPVLNIPLAALLDPKGRRLIERFAVSDALSLRALTLPGHATDAAGPAVPLLCAVDPAGAGAPVPPAPTVAAPKPPRAYAAVTRAGMGPLRHAREEAANITRHFPGAVTLNGPGMTESAVVRAMGSARVIHFATHGFLDRGRGLNSWLLTAPEPAAKGADPSPADLLADEPLDEHDGRLEAREVLGLSLRAELAVLSACDTGGGQHSGGDGLLGFAWAFRAAGCPAVVTSHWELDDAASSRFMAVFYQRLRAGDRKDDALRRAALAVKNGPDGRTARPFYWAAFHLTGDANPLRLTAPDPAPKARVTSLAKRKTAAARL